MPGITHVVDASALISYFKEEPGHEQFAELLADDENVLAIHIVNLCEVHYGYYRSDGPDRAEEAWRKAEVFLRVLDKFDASFIRRVGRWKATQDIPLADAFAAATAENDAVPLVTTDHGDFDSIEESGAIRIQWLR